MLYFVSGDIFRSPAQTIVNPVDLEGTMSGGLALEFKNRYPKMFEEYRHVCKSTNFKEGSLYISKGEDHRIMCFPVKRKWRNKPTLEYIEAGLKTFRSGYEKQGITSAAFPRLGCGPGGLCWEQVEPLMEKYLEDLPIDIYVYRKNTEIENDDSKNSKDGQVSA